MFYAVLALFVRADVELKTSEHSGVISTFDLEFVRSGKIDKRYSKALHKMYDARQEGDYRELVELTVEDAAQAVDTARQFLAGIKAYIKYTK